MGEYPTEKGFLALGACAGVNVRRLIPLMKTNAFSGAEAGWTAAERLLPAQPEPRSVAETLPLCSFGKTKAPFFRMRDEIVNHLETRERSHAA